MVLLGHVLHEQAPGNITALDHALVHAEHVTAPLRLVRAQGTGCVQDAGINQPTRARLQPIRLRQVQDPVVTLVPIFQALPHLRLRGARLKSHERVREVVPHVVVLRREVIRLRLAFLSHQLRLLGRLMHVVRNRTHVVEELRVHRPPPVLLPDRLADQRRTAVFDRLAQREPLATHHHIRQAFVRHTALVRRLRRRRKPTLVDAATVRSVSVGVVRMQLQAQAGLQEGTRHPRRRQPQQASRAGQLGLNLGFRGSLDGLQGGNGVHETSQMNRIRPEA